MRDLWLNVCVLCMLSVWNLECVYGPWPFCVLLFHEEARFICMYILFYYIIDTLQYILQAIMFGEESVDVCLAIQGSRVIKIAADVPKATLASVVGSMCIQNTVAGNESAKLNPLALNARLVLDSDSLGKMNESKSLGKVAIDVTPREGFGWVKPASKVIWEPSINEEFEQHEKKLASMVRTRGKRHDSKSRSEFLKAVTIGLSMCKKSDVSFSGEISAGILTTLIGKVYFDCGTCDVAMMNYKHKVDRDN